VRFVEKPGLDPMLENLSSARRAGKSQYMASSILAAVKAGHTFYSYDPKYDFPGDWMGTAELERQRFVLKSEFDSAKAALDRIDNHAQRLGNQIKRIRAVVDADDGRTTESKYLKIAAIAHEVDAAGETSSDPALTKMTREILDMAQFYADMASGSRSTSHLDRVLALEFRAVATKLRVIARG